MKLREAHEAAHEQGLTTFVGTGTAARGHSWIVIAVAEVHRYFPEWADRYPRGGRHLEADRNSYLAGGYAEEFGYHDDPECPECPNGMVRLTSDPEQCRHWRLHVGGVHPGYPECPRPDGRMTGAAGRHRAGARDRTPLKASRA